jgi:four helix bundle protein
MAGYLAFEETKIWQESRTLVKDIYLAIQSDTAFSQDYALGNQIKRAAISIPSNIAEGFERSTNKELIHFLFIAKGSAGEVRTQLLLASDLNYLNKNELDTLIEKAKTISKMIQGMINYLQKSEMKGTKYHNELREPNFESYGLENFLLSRDKSV